MTADKIKERAQYIDSVIEKFLPKEEGPAANVAKAMNYSIHVGGKRLRPMLMMEAFRMFGGTDDGILEPFMAAIEMIHTYSLCHDDLPAMDNDDMRRGMPSTHAKFGEAMGILAGDGLLNYAFETALSAFDRVGSCDEKDLIEKNARISKALRVLARKAGIYGMIGGQVVDVESEDKATGDITMDTIKYIHENKTAAMIESSLMIGSILAGASEQETDTMEKIGSDVGLAFQIQDDILDVTGSDETLGKPVGSDAKNGKVTYVTLVGLERAKEDVRTVSERSTANLSSLRGSDTEAGAFLGELIIYLADRDR